MSGFATAGEADYYYKGRTRVDVHIQTDRLILDTTAPLSVTRSQLGRASASSTAGSTVTRHISGIQEIHVDADNVSQLNQHAAQIQSAIPDAELRVVLQRLDNPAAEFVQYLTREIAFQLAESQTLSALESKYQLEDVRPITWSPATHKARVAAPGVTAALVAANTMQEAGEATWATPLIKENQSPRAIPNDPLFPAQWHLQNTGSNTLQGTAGNDLNVVPAWNYLSGNGVIIGINDDGLETTHTELAPNYRADLSYNFINNNLDPTPRHTATHGTSCAGVAAARGNNGVGITGVAPLASLAGLRTLGEPITQFQQASGLQWKASELNPNMQIHVMSVSWGPDDNGSLLDGPGPLSEQALINGVTQGRNGKGIVYSWAAGNGRGTWDNINKDGYASSPWVIAVGASNSAGLYSWYSEPGAPMLVNAPSGHGSDNILTTDLSGPPGQTTNDFHPTFTGTSAAAPAVAGVIALLLELNPSLTYRDVMHILVQSATQNDPLSTEWQTNGAGLRFNHNYGFGRVDATQAATLALTWENVPPLVAPVQVTNIITAPVAIPDNTPSGVTIDIPVSVPSNFRVEHVELEANIIHPLRGDISIELQSPSGMISQLMDISNDFSEDFPNWRFRSVAHWNESPNGTWKVKFADHYADEAGSITALTLRILGYHTSITSAEGWELY